MRKIVFDIETRNIFSDMGSNNPADLDISVVCIYDSKEDKYSSYTQEELPSLWPIIEKADLLIGYNSEHFDIPLLNKYYQGNLSKIKSVDLLKEIKNSLGRRLKLDSVAEATLGKNKSGNGLDAIVWWNKGEIEKIKQYCIEDVKITKELYDFALKNKYLSYRDGKEMKRIPIDSSNWEKEATNSTITHTLPF
jgi:DEAD/DEAH box helicase domain-containing protein